MALNLCPNCGGRGFFWSLNDDERTSWLCSQCRYSADEDESAEKPCPVCGKPGAVLLTHGGQTFYWCVLCGDYREPAA